jgi:hypothetical protein
MKLLIMQSSPASRHFLPLRSKYSPQHPVLKHRDTEFINIIQPLSLDPNIFTDVTLE